MRIVDSTKKIAQEVSTTCRSLGSELPADWVAMITAQERLTLLQAHNNELFDRHATFQAGDESLNRLRREHEALVTVYRQLLGRHAGLEDDHRRLSQRTMSWLSVSGFVIETLFCVTKWLATDPPPSSNDLRKWRDCWSVRGACCVFSLFTEYQAFTDCLCIAAPSILAWPIPDWSNPRSDGRGKRSGAKPSQQTQPAVTPGRSCFQDHPREGGASP